MKYLQVEHGVFRLMGWATDGSWPGSAGQYEEVADAIGRSAAVVWENGLWGRLLHVEEFAVVVDGDDGSKYVPWAGVLDGAAVLGVFQRNPRTHRHSGAFDFLFSARGIELSFLAGDAVWAEYRPVAPRFSRRAWDVGDDYLAGDVVYHEGDCWLALVDDTGTEPGSDDAVWGVQRVPVWMRDAITRLSFAELLRNDGRGDRADVEEARGMQELERALLTQEAQQGQARGISVSV